MAEKLTIICMYLLSFLIGMAIGIIIISFVYRGSKFCPECGHHYETKVEYCPIDGTELKEVTNS